MALAKHLSRHRFYLMKIIRAIFLFSALFSTALFAQVQNDSTSYSSIPKTNYPRKEAVCVDDIGNNLVYSGRPQNCKLWDLDLNNFAPNNEITLHVGQQLLLRCPSFMASDSNSDVYGFGWASNYAGYYCFNKKIDSAPSPLLKVTPSVSLWDQYYSHISNEGPYFLLVAMSLGTASFDVYCIKPGSFNFSPKTVDALLGHITVQIVK